MEKNPRWSDGEEREWERKGGGKKGGNTEHGAIKSTYSSLTLNMNEHGATGAVAWQQMEGCVPQVVVEMAACATIRAVKRLTIVIAINRSVGELTDD